MRIAVGFGTVACLVAFVAVAASLSAPPSTSPPAQTAAADATARIVASAQAFLATMNEAGRTKVQFPFDNPQKTRWSNLPTGIFNREGLRLGDLAPAQRAAAMALLSTALSQEHRSAARQLLVRGPRRSAVGGRERPRVRIDGDPR